MAIHREPDRDTLLIFGRLLPLPVLMYVDDWHFSTLIGVRRCRT